MCVLGSELLSSKQKNEDIACLLLINVLLGKSKTWTNKILHISGMEFVFSSLKTRV